MSHCPRLRFLLFAVVLSLFSLPLLADVTVSGTVLFSSLDGSALDDDHTVNGIFTVNGNLTVTGSINCNDVDKGSSACPMQFVVSGNVVLTPGSSISAENRVKDGNGGDITFAVGGNMDVQGTSGATPGALITSSKTNSGPTYHAGTITINTGGTFTDGAGSIISAAAVDGTAGNIFITSGAQNAISGYILAGPSRTLTTTIYTSAIMAGSGGPIGGNINIKANTSAEPGVVINPGAVVASQSGDVIGGGTVTLEGCNVQINGLVASVGKKNPGEHVIVRSGTSITVDGTNLGGTGAHLGRLRADANDEDASTNSVEIYAKDGITVVGPASGMFAVSSNPGAKGGAGSITAIATGGTISASGLAFSASGLAKDETGGTINLSAKGGVTLAGTSITAAGGTTGSNRAGGHINVRSYSGAIIWTSGTGDVRPVGSSSGIPSAQQGTVSLTYCTTLTTTGTSFPTNGSPVGTFPATSQTCSPSAPTLPAGNTLPTCNTPPVANNDAYTVAEGGTLNVPAPGVLANDTDAENNPLTAVLVSGPSHASSFTFNSDGSFNYVHDGGETTSDSFTYKANDGSSDSNVATVTITITPVNDPPHANNDSYNVNEGGTLNVAAPGVLGNDTDPDSPTLHAVLVSGPAHASSFTLNADGSFTYVHDGSETTSDSFTYKANDGSLDSNVATVNITINPVNDAPTANNDAYTVAEGGSLTIAAPGVLANDTDPDSPTIHAVLVSGPAHASSFTLNANGSFSYVHDGSETTSDSFTYKANDGSLDSNVATVNITITPVNDAPVANNDAYTVLEGGTLSVAAPGVLGNDTDPDSPVIHAILVSGPAHASSFTLNANGSFNYVHDGSETTSDSFTYKANDGSLDSNVATVNITVTPVNDPPVANDDSYSVDEAGTLNVAAPGVLGNDTDPDGPTISAVLVTGPAHASSFTLNANGSFTYVHDGSETTSDSFTYKANDSLADSNVATVHITVNPVNDAPVVTAGATLAYTENDPPTPIDNTVTVSDNDSANLTSATVSITANYVSGQDVLGFTNTANITGSFNPGSGTLTLTGSDTVANYQAALRSVTYVNTSDDPSSAPRTISWQVNDGAAVNNLSNVATSTISVTPINDAPVVTAGGTLSYTENQAPTAIDATLTVTDADSTNLTGATAQITANYVNGQDVLSFSNTANITGSFNAATGTMTLTGADTVANYQAALRTIKYQNTSDNPSTATRTVTWLATDGSATSSAQTSTISVTSVNDAPLLTAGATLAYTENDPATVIDNTVTVSDSDSASIVGATVSITANFNSTQDVLSFAPIGPITGSYNAGTGVLTLTGTDTVANYQAALRTVKYANTSENPTSATRTVSWQVDDGAAVNNLSNVATSTITVTSVNDAPVVTAGGTLSYTENQAPTAIDTTVTVSDVDSANLVGATAQITANYVNGEDILSFTNTANITGSFNAATGTMTLSGTDTVANYQAALRSVTYVNTSENPSTAPRTVSWQVDDGEAANNLSAVVTSTINVTSVNDAPVVTAGATLTYTENDPATVIDNTVTVSDSDSTNIIGATVSITGNFAAGQDVLSFATIGPISGSYNAGTGVLTLTGTDTLANYQAALRTVTYFNSSENPSALSRTVTWVVDDGAASNNLSAGVTSSITVVPVNDPPVLANTSTLAYTENDPATAINTAITVSDVDSTNLTSATVQITTNYNSAQDVLSFTNAFGITGIFNSATGTLTLSGSASVANYQAALRTVKYSNTSDDPTTATRTVVFQVDDGGSPLHLSNTINSTVSVTAVNDPPTAFAYSGLPAQSGIQITYPAGKLGGTDLEAGTTITIDTTPINLVNIAQLTINANGSFTMTPTPGSAGGTASFQYRVSDNGNPAPGLNSSYVTVSFAVAGPAIYFVKNPAVGTANCTLGNECLMATAIANIGAGTNAYIYLGDGNTHTPGATITLNSGGSIIGQGITTPFDTFFGISAPAQGTLAARPTTNGTFPTVGNTVALNTNSQARGFNISVSGANSGITSSGKTGLQVALGTVSTNNSTAATTYAVDLGTSSGTLFTFGAITGGGSGATSNGFRFNSTTSTTTVTTGTITTTLGSGFTAASTGGTAFSVGNISTSSGAGVSVTTTTGNFTFSNVTTTTGTAVTTSGTGAGNFSFGTVSTTTGQAINIATGTGAFTFTKISAGTAGSGPTKGIQVSALTGSGSFTVNGTGGLCDATHISGTDCTGGTIQKTTARGAEFINVKTVTLNNMYFKSNSSTVAGGCIANVATGADTSCNGPVFLQTVGTTASLDRIFIDGSSQMGILTNGVNAFSLTNSEVTNVGSVLAAEQSAAALQNLSGTCTISGNHFHDNDWGHEVFITINTGTATVNFTNNTVDNVTIANPQASDGYQIQTYNSANVTALVGPGAGTCNFTKLKSNGVTMGANNASTLVATLDTCTIFHTSGVFFQGSGTSHMTGNVTNNIITNKVNSDWVSAGNGSNGITIGKSSGASAATFTGVVTGNQILKANCGGGCTGIDAGGFGQGTTTMTINNNSIQHVDANGIRFIDGQATTNSNSILTIHGNNITNPDTNNNYAVDLEAGSSAGDVVCIAATIGDMSVGHTVPADQNTVTNGSTGFNWLQYTSAGAGHQGTGPAISGIVNTVGSTFRLFNYTGITDTQAQAWFVASNPGTSSDSIGPYTGGTSCP